MTKKKEKITETPNKEADVKAFVEENTGKTLSSKDIEKSKKSLKKTTEEFYDSNPEKKEARKKQVKDYKEYKARRISGEKPETLKSGDEKNKEEIIQNEVKEEAEETFEKINEPVGKINETGEEENILPIQLEGAPIKPIEDPVVPKETPKEPIKDDEKKPKQTIIPVAPYGYSHMGISYD